MEEPRVAPEPGTQTREHKEITLEVEGKHITICKILLASDLKKKTNRYIIFNAKSYAVLAEIYWHGSWRQYCLFPEPQCVWSTSCLDTVVEFVKKINTEHKDKIVLAKYNNRKS